MFEDIINSLDSFATNPDNLDSLAQVKEALIAKGKEIETLNTNNTELNNKVSELRDMNQKLYLKTSGIQPVTPEQTAPTKEEAPKMSGFEKISLGLHNENDKKFVFTPSVNFGKGLNNISSKF